MVGRALHPGADHARRQGGLQARGGRGRARAGSGRGVDRVPRSGAGPVGDPRAARAEADSAEFTCRVDGNGSEHDQSGTQRIHESARAEPAFARERLRELRIPAPADDLACRTAYLTSMTSTGTREPGAACAQMVEALGPSATDRGWAEPQAPAQRTGLGWAASAGWGRWSRDADARRRSGWI